MRSNKLLPILRAKNTRPADKQFIIVVIKYNDYDLFIVFELGMDFYITQEINL